jgi:hypothetical protein
MHTLHRSAPAGMSIKTVRFSADTLEGAYKRSFKRVGTRELAYLMRSFSLSPKEAGELFDVTLQAVDAWSTDGVPPKRMTDVKRLATLARTLRSTFRAETVPSIVRRPNNGLRGQAILDVLMEADGIERVNAALDRLLAFVPPSAA